MTRAWLRQDGRRERPLVAVLWSVPLLAEAVGGTLEFADVRAFAADSGDITGLLEWVRPDAIVVDSLHAADEAAGYAGGSVPVLHIALQERVLRLFRDGAWEQLADGGDADPESVRNVVAGVLFARGDVTS